MAKGAVDAGAAAIRAPSAVGGTQINFLPANADPTTITPVDRQTIAIDGSRGPVRSASTVNSMPPYSSSITKGSLEMPAMGHRASASNFAGRLAGADSLVHLGIDVAAGKEVGVDDVAGVGVDIAVGKGAAIVTERLAPRFGAPKAGGAIGGAIQATASGYTNYKAYAAGEISGEQAVANATVDTLTAATAGGAGAAIGATVGSAVPIAGTAVGAVVGFAAGVGVHYAIQAADSALGFTSAAKESLANKLESTGDWLKSPW